MERLLARLHHGVSIQSPIINLLMRGEHHVEHPSSNSGICFNWFVTDMAL
jgi:hypothetical protein